ncbi:MAG TPA: hypothetical protein VK524_03130 [Polyangiaceae bacterium]|nr:hypothetical protein [Polyangiaceae bacterium]
MRAVRWDFVGRSRSVGLSLCGLALMLLESCTNRPVAELSPKTSNIFVELVANSTVNKIDLLFMIDNSKSMADKQSTLSEAVPALVRRLVTPPCLDENGASLGDSDQEGRCAQGRPEFRAIRDIHIGVITSSLGAHGGDACNVAGGAHESSGDNAHLLATLNRGSGLDTAGLGFLKWAPDGDGESDSTVLIDKFTRLVRSVEEKGCGYESSLEAWYRFLIDPEPPAQVSVAGLNEPAVVSGVDTAVLEQRAKFLRPDSLVAIIMLTDENDCSVRDQTGFVGHWVSRGAPASRSTSTCEQEPNSPCCRTCAFEEAEVPQGCMPAQQDPNCKPPAGASYYSDGDPLDHTNLRCFDQKRRFGVDLLWPTSRYVQGLTEPRVPNARGELVPNPLFQAPPGVVPRVANQVFLAGIVGVPWQDIATPESLAPGNDDQLEYLSYDKLNSEERWDVIVGDPSTYVAPQDPFMVESVTARVGVNPILDVRTSANTSLDPRANPINGHEADYTSSARDLQYACTYPLPAPIDCAGDDSCDCASDELRFNRPLCNPPSIGPAGTMQYFAKAYPGLRHLEVLKDVGAVTTNAIVGSICPKVLASGAKASPAYGYNPALHALVDRLKAGFKGGCMSRELSVKPDGSLPCTVVETQPVPLGQSCSADNTPPDGCDAARGRQPASSRLARSVRAELASVGACGGADGPACSDFCMCQLLPVAGAGQSECQNNPDDAEVQSSEQAYGFCYVDPKLPPFGQGIGDPKVVENCLETEPRRLRFIGKDTPAKNSITLMACAGESG